MNNEQRERLSELRDLERHDIPLGPNTIREIEELEQIEEQAFLRDCELARPMFE